MYHRILFTLMTVWICFGASAQTYHIQGRIHTDKPVSWAYLYGFTPKRELLDSAQITAGKFHFEGQCPLAISAQVQVKGIRNSLSFFLEPGAFRLELQDTWGKSNQVVGGTQNAIEKAYAQDTDFARDSLAILAKAYDKGTTEERVALSSDMRRWNNQLDAVRRYYIQTYPNSVAMLEIVRPYIDILNYQGLSELVDTFSPDLAYTGTYKHLIAKYEQRKSEQLVGGPAPNIVSKTVNGKPFALSSLRGKLVLLDFWASWCAPCRVGNRALIPIYEKYKSKGFEIVSFSMDDKANLWKDAIKADGIPWTQVSDLQGLKGSETAKSYFIQSLPTIFLIDELGNVIAQNISKEELEQILCQRFD